MMDSASIDAALELGLMAAAGLLAASMGGLLWIGPGRRALARRRAARALTSALEAARAQRQEATDALVRTSRDYAAFKDAVRADIDAQVAAQRGAIVEALTPVAASLTELLRAAPEGHVLTPGLQLVARQLDTVLGVSAPSAPDSAAAPDASHELPPGG